MTKEQRPDWGVIFDVDGTMVNNAEFHQAAWIQLGNRYNKSITPEFYQKHIHAHSNDSIVRTLFGDITNEMITKISSEKEIIYRQSFRPVIKEICGLTDLLKALNTKVIPCAAASNSPKGNVDMVLDELDIRKYFRVIIDNDQVNRGKPDPEILFTAAAELGLAPQKCIVFEDSLSGFEAARRAEMPCIAITAGADKENLNFPAGQPAHKDFTTIRLVELKTLAG
jgi:beta-phosphoglucomutase